MPNFPHKVWDGTTASRPNLDVTSPPGYSDWTAMLGELQATQDFLLKLAANMDVMPDLKSSLEAADAKLSGLLDRVSEITPPRDLVKEVDSLAEKIDEVDIRDEHKSLQNGARRLFMRTKISEKAFREFKADVRHQLEVLAHSFRNQLAKVQKGAEEQHERLTAQLVEMENILQNPDLGD